MNRGWTMLLLATAVACREGAAPVRRTVAQLTVVQRPADSAAVGTDVGDVVVKVADADGAPVGGAAVAFATLSGGATLQPVLDTSLADGTARSHLVLGTTPGVDSIRVVAGSAPALKFAVVATPGAARTVQFNLASPQLRFLTNVDSQRFSVTPRDGFGNAIMVPVTLTSRDPTLLRARAVAGGAVSTRVLRRPGQTWLVATSGAAADSIHVLVYDATSTACDFVASPRVFAVGQVVRFDEGTVCVATTSTHAEFALVENYDTGVGDALQPITASALGVVAADTQFPVAMRSAVRAPAPDAAVAFERALRARERAGMPSYVAGARAWYRDRSSLRAAVAATPRVGDTLTLNTNAFSLCSDPTERRARVVAVTNTAVIVADELNPPDGFSSEEYRDFGIAMDTLVSPVDTAAFGTASDIDGNGRAVVFFTSAVNALTDPGSPNGVILGFFFQRDLLPRAGPFGACGGSNAREMFYVLVPDVTGTINGNVRTKAYVSRNVVGVIAHEYQHLINASRRMYVNDAPQANEEPWLNEGLSHIAEELLFYRVSGMGTHQDIGASALAPGTAIRDAFDRFQTGNFGRYRLYLRQPDLHSPFDPVDYLETRGATWSFLRYLADRTQKTDGDFWHRLVNSRHTGVANLDDVLSGSGLTTISALDDWSVSVLADDHPDNTSSVYQQPSWNFVSAMSVLPPNLSYTLFPRTMSSGGLYDSRLLGGGSDYLRFAVRGGKPALIRVTAFRGGAVPPGVRLSIVRLK